MAALEIKSKTVTIQNPDLNLHYTEAGEGEVILLLHGWPTSSYLWRKMMLPLARNNRVIALDLPGFGKSDKPLSGSYSFNYHDRALEAFLAELGIKRLNLAVHDLGGPIGLMWALRHQEKLIRLVLLDTLVYPEFSWAVKLFALMTRLPGVRGWLSSKAGIAWSMRLGVFNKANLSEQDLTAYQAPFSSGNDRKVLLKVATRLSMKGFADMAEMLPELKAPVLCIYGENDRILPEVAQTMARVKRDLPQAQLKALPNCGHFLQEDEPDKIADLMCSFLDSPA